MLRKRVKGGRVLKLIEMWLQAGILDGQEMVYPDKGSPQGCQPIHERGNRLQSQTRPKRGQDSAAQGIEGHGLTRMVNPSSGVALTRVSIELRTTIT